MDGPLQIVDSHTEGEPTRTIVGGFPDLHGTTMAERREDFKKRFDHLRRGLILEPRGHDAVVGALLTEPVTAGADAGVIFFNDAGYLGMCGHGTIGVAETLRHLGRAKGETVILDTLVGRVEAKFEPDSRAITIRNVPSRTLGRRTVQGEFGSPAGGEAGPVEGEVAYGGNWFFLLNVPGIWLDMKHNLEFLMLYTKGIRFALELQGFTGDEGALIDHVELFAPTRSGAKNFVLCPGNAYDRSPCGTGTSAKLACMAEKGELAPGEPFEVESITGGRFTARYTIEGGQVIPWITGRAFITGLMQPVFNPQDPFVYGF